MRCLRTYHCCNRGGSCSTVMISAGTHNTTQTKSLLGASDFSASRASATHMGAKGHVHLESQWPVDWGCFVAMVGYFGIERPLLLGYFPGTSTLSVLQRCAWPFDSCLANWRLGVSKNQGPEHRPQHIGLLQ